MNTFTDLTLAGVKALYAAGTSPAELMSRLRAQAQQYADRNIFIHLLSDAELAPYVDALADKDPVTSPLWGVPFVLKDNMDLAGIPTTAACEAFAYTPTHSAVVVQQLIDQGALPLGKANLDQFATGLNGTRSPWGPCANSFDKLLISGGSSSGSAVAVALGLASFSLGTDTAGSGRVPAAFNNLVGVKPTRGLLSSTGVVPACRSLDCVSIFALHCDDANAVLAAAEGTDINDGYSRENPYDNRAQAYGRFDAPLTLGVIAPQQLKFFGDSHYRQAYQSTLDTLRDAGIRLQEIDYAPFDEVARLLYEGPWVAERYVATLPLIEEQPQAVFPVVRQIIEKGGEPSAAELFKAQYRLKALEQACRSQLAQVDALLTPTAGTHFSIEQMQAEPIRHNSELGYYMNHVNLLDLAALAVPVAMTPAGLPFGVTLSAEAFTDRRLLSIGNRIQSLCQLALGVSDLPVPASAAGPVGRSDWTQLVVCGAHMRGMPLNHQLTDRGGRFVEQTQTADGYMLYALTAGAVPRPALVRAGQVGAAIEVELWSLPSTELGSFLKGIAAPLGLGKVMLCDGREVCGFIAEACAADQGPDITHLGGWRRFCDA